MKFLGQLDVGTGRLHFRDDDSGICSSLPMLFVIGLCEIALPFFVCTMQCTSTYENLSTLNEIFFSLQDIQ